MHLLAVYVYLGQVSGAMLNFLGEFWKKHNGESEEPVAACEDVYKMSDSCLLAEIDEYFGGNKKKVEVVDMNLIHLIHHDLFEPHDYRYSFVCYHGFSQRI